MKVLFVFSIGHMSGGAAAVWMNLIDGLRPMGVEPYVVVPRTKDDTMVKELERRGVPYEVDFFTWWTTPDANPRSVKRRLARTAAKRVNAKADAAIARIIKQEGIDLLFISDGTIEAGLAPAKAAGIPVVWHFHEIIDGSAGCLNFIDAPQRVASQLVQADCVLSVSKAVQNSLASQFPQLSNLRYIRNGVTDANVVPHQVFAGEGVTFTLAQRLDDNKGQHRAVAAFSKIASEFPQARLRFAGIGKEEYTARLKEQVANSGCAGQIEVMGFVKDMAGLWSTTDVALNCSYMEGCSMSVIECIRSGCLLLASDAVSNVELVEDGRGLLYPVDDIDALAQKMRWVIENPAEAAAIAKKGQEWANANLSLPAQVASIAALLSELTGEELR